MPSDPQLEQALHDLEATANSFATRLIRIAQVRSEYVAQIHEMSQSIRAAVEAGELSPARGAELANQQRNQILEMARLRDYDLGRSLARQLKAKGITLEQSIAKAMKKLGLEGMPFERLSGEQQRQVYLEIVEAAGRSRPAVTARIPRLRWAGRGLWLATLAIAAYNIGTAENPWWQTGREGANIAGGFGGGFVGGAAMGAAGGVWVGPIGVAVGVVVGGILGALLADHAYVEAAGTSNPATRQFVGRFTSFWTGTDEAGMARGLATEYRSNAAFVQQVLLSLEQDYSSDADDVALAYVGFVRRDAALQQLVRANGPLRALLVRLMDEGWTSGDEQNAIRYLRAL
jgi:hypothetical protein